MLFTLVLLGNIAAERGENLRGVCGVHRKVPNSCIHNRPAQRNLKVRKVTPLCRSRFSPVGTMCRNVSNLAAAERQAEIAKNEHFESLTTTLDCI